MVHIPRVEATIAFTPTRKTCISRLTAIRAQTGFDAGLFSGFRAEEEALNPKRLPKKGSGWLPGREG